MRIIFVRHGQPNYQHDSLTELGHRQAEAAAERLENEPIERVYSSTCGRAFETAEHIAARFHLPVDKCEFMREIGWGTVEGEPLYQNGHPWRAADRMVAAGESIVKETWAAEEPFCRNKVTFLAHQVGENLDRWLSDLGFEREEEHYRVTDPRYDTVVMASHGGSSTAALAHLFNLPFPFVCSAIRPDFTAITVVKLPGNPGELISPQFELVNDTQHIAGLQAEKTYRQ